jgi:hypothetical protein
MARKWEQQSRSHFSLPLAATLSKLVLVRLCAKFEGAERMATIAPLTLDIAVESSRALP